MYKSLYKIIIFSFLLTMAFSFKVFAETSDIVDELVIVQTEGDYDEEEVENIINRINHIDVKILNALYEQGVQVKLINFPLTSLSEWSFLKGVTPRGWSSGTWEDVPGAGGNPTVVRIGHSERGSGHGSLNLELHEIAHPIDKYVFHDISYSDEFTQIHAEEQGDFLPSSYFRDYKEEYFAESFSYYYLNEETREELREQAPKTFEFMENLHENIPSSDSRPDNKDGLKEAFYGGRDVYNEFAIPELQDALIEADLVYYNPASTQEEIEEAEQKLRNAVEIANNPVEEVMSDLITIVTRGEYDVDEATKMITRINSIDDNLLQGLVDSGVVMKLVNFPITYLGEWSHLKGVVPRGWEDTGLTWDDVPGVGGSPSVARIGYSDYGNGHSTINLELHEIAHPIDGIVLDNISSSDEFLHIHEKEQEGFLPNVYFEYESEYFAEAFAYYYLNDETRAELKEKAPQTFKFIKNLGNSVTKDKLVEAIKEASDIPEESRTAELNEALEKAEDVSNNPDATQEEVDDAEERLRAAINNVNNPSVEKGKLVQAIEEAGDIPEESRTAELNEALESAEAVYNNPDVTQNEVDEAEKRLRAAIAAINEQEEIEDEKSEEVENEGEQKEEEENESIVVDKQDGKKLPNTATNMYSYLLVGLFLIVIGSILIGGRRFFYKQY